ncbi:P-loop containing nucleoside triphosphate hydrolase [Syntrophomonas zehnderi OL-4]|uniref:p-loop containing nucleoside triphosphate hydrolase n=1 Tax=Syntrophomonas zehnderi OL-4 TaxID=690567 RepID=A0A0E3W2V2_9FIRM|nr:hypothetical protein [Syntrophomonas zehnderi]CFX23294.1 P-loop containing nucleoside triphosphate hydrolase [Syntrophomonas zehnderi OL-4]
MHTDDITLEIVCSGGVSFTKELQARIAEAYIGEYASGKSELSINRALELRKQGRRVNLVDLDTVEPFYTLRPIKKMLEEQGLNVIAFSKEDTFGLGETGAMLNPQARWALLNEGDVILDIGYGVYGAQTLNLVEGIDQTPELKVLVVLNASRPLTNSPARIKGYLSELGRVDGIVANTHMGDDTTIDIISAGNQMIIETAREMQIPVKYFAVDKKFEGLMPTEQLNVPVKYIQRYMPMAIW